MSTSKKILVAPLDWGLGHATRCMPIINQLLEMGHQPILATDGRAYDLLQAEYPNLPVLRLEGYHPEYPEDGKMVLSMGWQLPRFMAAIAMEHATVAGWTRRYDIDGIISDNRYGLYGTKVPSVFITHQVNILMPEWASFLTSPVGKLNQFFLERFDRCWIPDLPGEHNLAGELSRAPENESHYRNIGLLSRLNEVPNVEQQYDLLVLLSGPEPQRTLLEKKLLGQLEPLNLKTLLVQGITEKKERTILSDKLEISSYLGAEELAIAMASSKMVIARSGYSTVMDLVKLQKKALLIPTPGQTEQEYLAAELKQKGYFHSARQEGLNLANELPLIASYSPPVFDKGDDLLKKELLDWLATL